jgi:hypothetical protein
VLCFLCLSPLKLCVLPAESTQTGVYRTYGDLGYGVAPSCPNTDGQTAEIRVSTGARCLQTENLCMKHAERRICKRREHMFERRGEMDMQTERTYV